MISTFSHGSAGSIVAGIFVLFATIGFICLAAADLLMLMKVNHQI
jgi:hypothetical protein